MHPDRSNFPSEKLQPEANSDKYRHPLLRNRQNLGILMDEKEAGLNMNSTGRPTESTNLDPWGSHCLNHQAKNRQSLDLCLPAYCSKCAALSSGESQTNVVGVIQKAVAFVAKYVGFILLTEMPCMASIRKLKCQGEQRFRGRGTPAQRRRGEGLRVVEGVNRKRGVSGL
jgi:hypothetical protein